MLTNSREWKNEEICLSSIFVKNSCSDFFPYSLVVSHRLSFDFITLKKKSKSRSFQIRSIAIEHPLSLFVLRAFFPRTFQCTPIWLKMCLYCWSISFLYACSILVVTSDMKRVYWQQEKKKEDGGGWREKKRTADNGDELFIDD